jgi:hypothetical protein
MRMTSIGAQRNKKTVLHFTDNDYATTPTVAPGDTPNLRVWVHGRRRYKLTMTPCDVVKFLMHLPPETIAGAVAAIADDVNIAAKLPEVLKQLAAGALTPASVSS